MDFLHQIFGPDLQGAAVIIFNLIIIESLLSVDNAAVLATMVMDLPKEQRGKALKYGIFGAYFFRGLCLLLATFIIKIWWLKPLGGLYLLYLAYDYFNKEDDREDPWLIKIFINPFKYVLTFLLSPFNGLWKWLDTKRQLLGMFWSTVVLVEVMDLAFSIDNVLAVVAYTENIWMICIGVFIGILSMRFVATSFVKLMEKFPFLETAAFIVIAVLGLKLALSLYTHYRPEDAFSHVLEGHENDKYLSIFTCAIFFVPVLTSIFFNFPKRAIVGEEKEEL